MTKRILSVPFESKIWWIAAMGASLGMIVSARFLPGGDDLYRYYLPFVQGCLDCGFVPYFAQWFLWPLRLLPSYPYAWFIWTILAILCLLLLVYRTGVNPFLFLVSFPVLGQIWLGQIDVVICLGMVMFLSLKNPYGRGLGIILALSKPQLMVLPVFFTLLLENPKVLPKLLLVPALVLLGSMLIYGWDWPMHWFTNAKNGVPAHVWRLASIEIWRFGVFLLPLPLIVKDPIKRFEAGLLVSALATPFFGVYSYVAFLLLETKWWALVLSYSWLLGYFWLKESAMVFAWILPLAMLIALMYQAWTQRTTPVIEGTDTT